MSNGTITQEVTELLQDPGADNSRHELRCFEARCVISDDEGSRLLQTWRVETRDAVSVDFSRGLNNLTPHAPRRAALKREASMQP